MLKIAKSVEYSIFALRYIHYNSNTLCVSAKEISEKENIPFELLAKLLQKMVRKGLVVSQQGNKGGYTLAVSPDNLSLLEIINSLDQNIQLTNCMFEGATKDDCGRLVDCCIRNPMSKIQNRLLDVFGSTKLSELI